jgi:hypothetical protein
MNQLNTTLLPVQPETLVTGDHIHCDIGFTSIGQNVKCYFVKNHLSSLILGNFGPEYLGFESGLILKTPNYPIKNLNYPQFLALFMLKILGTKIKI